MKVTIMKMRENGVTLSRSRLADSMHAPVEGELSLSATTNDQLHQPAFDN